jgi:microsomal dipeptidase-like Zn-dependent dipeptidase
MIKYIVKYFSMKIKPSIVSFFATILFITAFAQKDTVRKLIPIKPVITNNPGISKIPKTSLTGWVDMHTHPAAQWGFGEQIFFGDNDGDPALALGSCGCMHNFVVPPFDGSCGLQNMYRNSMVDKIDQENHINPAHSKVAGFPHFDQWPKHNSILHQQMYVDWIKRAKEGGLRVMVALAVSSNCLADAAETGGPNDDLRSMNTQLDKMKSFFSRHLDFMEIAYSPKQLRSIIASGRLAVILGVEMDNIGNFYNPADRKGQSFNPTPSQADVKREIDRLFDLGVRYIFPIHITNNVFGGTALYNSGFNVANKYNTGRTFVPEAVDASGGISFKLTSAFSEIRQDFLAGLAMGVTGPVLPNSVMPDVPGNYPNYTDPGFSKGHRNSIGLTPLGEVALQYMMSKGMIIDIDHMSERAVNRALAIANNFSYPLNSGHNGFRGNGANNENSRTDDQVRTIYRLGGLMGLGHGDNATNFVNNYHYGIRLTSGLPLAIGTDVNGFYPLPGPPSPAERIDYRPPMTRATMGGKTWDFNNDGMAHYGLLPDYIESCKKAGMTTAEQSAFSSAAERFAQMWEKCNSSSTLITGGGIATTRTITPANVGVLCPSILVAGDREFGGHGPQVKGNITLRISPDGNNLHAVITFNAKETTSDWSEVRGSWTINIGEPAPAGFRFTAINGATVSSFDRVLSGGGRNEVLEGCDGGEHIITPAGGPVSKIIVVGDTGGGDISADNDCNCDTRIVRIELKPVSLTLAPR